MDYRHSEEFHNRTRKMHELKQLGIDPYPHSYPVTEDSAQLHTRYEQARIGSFEDAELGNSPCVHVSGRLILFRSMGKNAFAHIQDRGGKIQILFNKDHTHVVGFNPSADSEEYSSHIKLIEKKLDLGDIIGIEGNLFHTQKGELTIYAKKVTLLCKSLLPLADKHGGLNDKETRYRKRWLDLITHTDVQKTFRIRSHILKMIRTHFDELGFLEVETPVLQSSYGGAQAKPFLTRLHALEQDMFLRIALEIPLKKLIVGGLDRVFEVGKAFRNEGIDRNHNPEFTVLESYAANWDYEDMMRLVEMLFERVAISIFGSPVIPFHLPEVNQTVHLNMKAPWKRLTMKQAIQEYGGIDIDEQTDATIHNLLIQDGMAQEELKGLSRGLLIAALFESRVEDKLVQPHHITDHPIETTPLCKPHRDPIKNQEGLIERFESYVLGHELCNAYSELNDPELQRKLLEIQAQRLQAGDEEANPLDEEFIEAICQGMPPCGGLGIGIDRMIMLFTNSSSIKDVLYFPWMKPQPSTTIENQAKVEE